MAAEVQAEPESPAAALLHDGPREASHTVVLAHGAGAPMDSDAMQALAHGLSEAGLHVVRFEFPYMRERRTGGRRGPDRMPVLQATYRSVVASLGAPQRIVIGGRSMGGRVASMIADELQVAGVLCFGYPFHPPAKPGQLRTAHLATLRTPTLIVQGTRDPFGTRDEIAGYALSPAIRLHMIEDGDHSFVPRKSSGRSEEETVAEAVEAAVAFIQPLA